MDSTGVSAPQGNTQTAQGSQSFIQQELTPKLSGQQEQPGRRQRTGTAQCQAGQISKEQFQGQQLVVPAPNRDSIASVAPEWYRDIGMVPSTPSNLIIQNLSDEEPGLIQPKQIQGTKNITEEVT